MKFKIYSIILLLILFGCSKNDDHIFTLYSSYQGNRLHVATFDTEPNSWGDKNLDAQFKKLFSDDNLSECNKVAELLAKDWIDKVNNKDTKYWCEKGRYRK